jgi:shikimate kinase
LENRKKNKRIYLVGFMGAGKTTFGKKLAAKMNFRFFDIDKEFERKYKTTVDLFFKKYGEKPFRNIEYEMLISTFEMENVVVSTGGGTPVFFDSMDLIKRNGVSIYLQMTPEALYSRLVHAKRLRPLLANLTENELLEFIKEKLTVREPYYKQSDYIVSGLSTDINLMVDLLNKFEK